jgi:uncharacterized linocin/CFP29 family protein
MDHLLREKAPIPDSAWAEIESEARSRLTPHLAARRLVDWNGPHGWTYSAANLGRIRKLSTLAPGITNDEVQSAVRQVQPVIETRVPFRVSRAEIDAVERGALDADWADLERAARRAALAENTAIFKGWPEAGIAGISAASSCEPIPLGTDAQAYPAIVAHAVDQLRQAGISGPYAMAIGPEGYTHIVETTERGGYPLFDHLSRILDGKVVWAPGVEGAIVLSQRGGDFLLDVGQDLAIGYTTHDAETVSLYLEESFTFRVTEPGAAVVLTA